MDCTHRTTPAHLAAQALAAASAIGWFMGEWSVLWLAIHAAIVVAGALWPQPTPGARMGHHRMLKDPL